MTWNSRPGVPHLEHVSPSRRVPQLSHHLQVSFPCAVFWAIDEGFCFIFIWMSPYLRGMQDPYEYEIHVNPGYGKKRFSKRELGDIAISMIVMTLAFTILYRSYATQGFFVDNFGETGSWFVLFGLCLVLVLVSFLMHEFGHKFVAQRYGMWSEYRMYPMGLVLTLVTSFMGFLFAAPGAVYIEGAMNKERNGKISIAGPAVNIVLALISMAVLAVMCGDTFDYNGGSAMFMDGSEYFVFLVFSLLLSLNGFLAVFNLLPVPPLDGSKILAWNKVVWIVAFAIAAAALAYRFLCLPDTIFIMYR